MTGEGEDATLRNTRSRSTTRIEKPMSSAVRSNPYLSVEIILAPLDPCCAVGTGSSKRREEMLPERWQKSSVACPCSEDRKESGWIIGRSNGDWESREIERRCA